MEIKRKNSIQKAKVSELKIMSAYLILDDNGQEQILFINVDKKHCFVIGNFSNDKSLCCLHMSPKTEVSVIGKIYDFNITDLVFEYPKWALKSL